MQLMTKYMLEKIITSHATQIKFVTATVLVLHIKHLNELESGCQILPVLVNSVHSLPT